MPLQERLPLVRPRSAKNCSIRRCSAVSASRSSISSSLRRPAGASLVSFVVVRMPITINHTSTTCPLPFDRCSTYSLYTTRETAEPRERCSGCDSGLCTTIVEIVRRLRRVFGFGFRNSDLGIPAVPGCVIQTSDGADKLSAAPALRLSTRPRALSPELCARRSSATDLRLLTSL
jgi:hypothetical protein